jgi:type VI secretion system protein ImpK
MASSQSRALLDCFVDVLAYAALFKNTCALAQPPFEQVNGKIRQLMQDSAQKMVTAGIDPRSYDDARFALCAWIDETVMNSPWQHRAAWQRTLLQSEYYNTVNAGAEFFDRLNQLHPDQNDVREIYYLCLGLGFAGRYSMEGDEFLRDQLKKSNLRSLIGQVLEPVSYARGVLFENAYKTPAGEVPAARGALGMNPRMRWLFIALPPLLVLGLFLIYFFVLNGVVDNVMLHVREG